MPEKVKPKSTKTKRPHKSRGRPEFTPIAGAGLLRFFREEVEGLSISPYIAVIMAIALIVVVLLLPSLLPL
ncbi:MAG: SEC61-beta family protein [Candidatus Nezhaarchaeota archaeon]|nr:SEC61-beta family protein [Candidatus Nezhaarchaeota archaeon]